ncbi:hypothetical protein [Pseudomonas aeruginosa]|nr:hypothetical protein [Pseudomonas aeruginosa]
MLPADMAAAAFAALPIFSEPAAAVAPQAQRAICTVEKDGRRLDIQIGSLASMKGETHLATLVLESLGHPGRRFDLEEALPVIAGIKARAAKISESQLSQLRNLYVGMSRPTSFLCLAVNAERVTEECKAALQGQGWTITHLT